jgi:hypothetical protein
MIKATLNKISALTYLSVLLVNVTSVYRGNYRPVVSYCQTLTVKLYRVHLIIGGIRVLGIDAVNTAIWYVPVPYQ